MRKLLMVGVALGVLGFAGGSAGADDSAGVACDRPLGVVVAVAPEFPSLPWKARIGRDQWVLVEVSDRGRVVNATLESEASPHLGFGVAALAAARRWEFVAQPQCPTRAVRLLFRFVMPVTKREFVGVQFHPPYEIDVVVEAFSVDTGSTQ
jgi:TonB family protein